MRLWLIVAFLVILGAACSQSAASNQTAEVEMESNDTVTTESGLQYKDLVVGEGEDARVPALQRLSITRDGYWTAPSSIVL